VENGGESGVIMSTLTLISKLRLILKLVRFYHKLQHRQSSIFDQNQFKIFICWM